MASWPVYLVSLGVVIVGLMAAEMVSERAAALLVLAIVLSVAILHPTFLAELEKLTQRFKL